MEQTLTENQNPDKPWYVAANGIAASVFLAFLTTAGIFYINIMPAVVSGLVDGLGFTSQQAGYVSSANLYGASVGALAAVFAIKHIRWRLWSFGLMLAILLIDFSSTFIAQPLAMIALRGLHGLLGGLLVGIGFGIISRTTDPDKTFGYLLFIQWGLGGLGLMYLPGLVPEYGTSVLFYALMMFTAVSLVMLIFLPDYPVNSQIKSEHKEPKLALIKLPNLSLLVLVLTAIFLFQAANMGLFAYMIAIGREEGLAIEFMSPSLGAASWVALVGAFLVMILGSRYGRMLPLTVGILVTAACTWALHFSEIASVYLYGNIIIGVGWAFVLPYLFGICSELDKAGQYAAMGGFASKMGLASGPLVGALLLHNEVYGPLINAATVGLLLCLVFAFRPAISLDRK